VFSGVRKPIVAVIGEKNDGECTQDNDAGLVVPLQCISVVPSVVLFKQLLRVI